MKPTLHLDILFRPTDEGYEAHCLQFDLVEVGSTAEDVEQAIKSVITAHIAYSLAHDNLEHLFCPAPQDAWNDFFSSQQYKHETLEIQLEQGTTPFPDTLDLQETLLEAA